MTHDAYEPERPSLSSRRMYNSTQLDAYNGDSLKFVVNDFSAALRAIWKVREESGKCSGDLIVGIDFALHRDEEDS